MEGHAPTLDATARTTQDLRASVDYCSGAGRDTRVGSEKEPPSTACAAADITPTRSSIGRRPAWHRPAAAAPRLPRRGQHRRCAWRAPHPPSRTRSCGKGAGVRRAAATSREHREWREGGARLLISAALLRARAYLAGAALPRRGCGCFGLTGSVGGFWPVALARLQSSFHCGRAGAERGASARACVCMTTGRARRCAAKPTHQAGGTPHGTRPCARPHACGRPPARG
eukprot:1482928-Prymnesium_polylepis.1